MQSLKDVKIAKKVQLLKKLFEKDVAGPIGTKALLIINKWRNLVLEYKMSKQDFGPIIPP